MMEPHFLHPVPGYCEAKEFVLILCFVKIVSGELIKYWFLIKILSKGNCCIRWRCVLLTCLFLAVILACLMLALPLLKKVSTQNVKSISISHRKKLQVVLDSLSCSSIENGDEGGKLGTNWMGRTAKQVQTKVLCGRKICKSESFCFKVDKGKIRTCSMYNWKRAERKEKASIYYRWHSLLNITQNTTSLSDMIALFRGGDVYKGEVSGLEGGPNAISR